MSIRDLLRLRPAAASLAGIERELKRLADAYETDLAMRGIIMRDNIVEAGPDAALYTDEEADAIAELKERLK
jgi:hypothetical protein